MENKIKFIVISAAIAMATILFFLGIRNLKLRKKNFFYTSLLIALTFLGCNFTETNARDPNDPDENSTKPLGKDDPEYIKELNKTSEWKEFKSFWQTIDRIEAAKDASPSSFGSYFGNDNNYSHTYQIHDSLAKKIIALEPDLKKLTDKNLLDTLESRLLINMCNERIDYIFYGHKSMMMRMVVHPGITEKENTMANFEFRVDTLLQLEEKGLIDSDEMKKAMNNIKQEIKKFGILDIIGKYNMFRFYSYEELTDFHKEIKSDTLNISDSYFLGFEKSYKDFMSKYDYAKATEQEKTVYNSYYNTKKELDSYLKNHERFCTIISDLILND